MTDYLWALTLMQSYVDHRARTGAEATYEQARAYVLSQGWESDETIEEAWRRVKA